MEINYDLKGSRRKDLVEAISDITSESIYYKGAPSFAYEIGDCVVDKNGVLSMADNLHDGKLALVFTTLRERGFKPVHDDKLTVKIPREGFDDKALDNLQRILASKSTLIKKALGMEYDASNKSVLTFEFTDDTLCFPWFTLTGVDGETYAYSCFVCALRDMAKKQTRVTAKEKESTNDKFTMRLFLIRLGFNGPQYKILRKIMLKNLSGNSSWKNGQPPQKPTDNTNSSDENGDFEPPEEPENSTEV